MTTSPIHQGDVTEDGEPTRRDFIHIFGAATAAAGAGAVLWPLVHQMNPDASVLALSTKEVDLSAVPVGQAIKVMWQGKPVFIRHRTQEEIGEAEATPLAALKDRLHETPIFQAAPMLRMQTSPRAPAAKQSLNG